MSVLRYGSSFFAVLEDEFEWVPEDYTDVITQAQKLLEIIDNDQDSLDICDAYMRGDHPEPYMPKTAGEEYRLLAKRACTNWMPLVVATPAQTLYVDAFRSGDGKQEHSTKSWKHWQDSNLDARQHAVYRAAFVYGHSFIVTEQEDNGKIISRGLSPRRTAALFDDPANDLEPAYALTKLRQPREVDGKSIPGTALMWDETNRYVIRFEGTRVVAIQDQTEHGATSCPVTRFACAVDLEGRTVGLVEPLIPLQDRLNQTVFDLLVAQTYGSFKVRTVTGMAPPVQTEAVYETDADGNVVYDANTGLPVITGSKPVLDPETGKPIPAPMQSNASRWQFAKDKDVKFGQLDETPLGGYIESIDMSIKHLSAVMQIPPHYLLGEIANLSADALQAAEISLNRKVMEFRSIFGESWERVFRLASELAGETEAANDTSAEVIWRDLESSSLSKTADALGKLRQNLEIPKEALWKMVPGVTQTTFEEWQDLADKEEPEIQLAQSINRATAPRTPRPAQEAVNGATSSQPGNRS